MKGLLLISGGLDSPVAGWIMSKQMELCSVHFSGEPFINRETEGKARKLSEIIGIKKFIVIPFGKIQEEVVNKCNHRYYYVITKRVMLMLAEKLAKEENCDYLVTGDSLGQVGSQTLSNMATITRAAKMEVLRPLLSYDKIETINLAKEIGTYELSTGPEMCSLLGPKHPATRSTLEIIEKEESKLDLKSLIQAALEGVRK